tara:strand:- start:112 stop:807 length:696 start_codon:yes stop_codon:yes gene_type:complete
MKKIIVLILALVAMIFGGVSFAHPQTSLNEITYNDIYHQAVNNCKNRSRRNMTIEHVRVIELMIDLEKSFGVPKELRGMLVAAACSESGYNSLARGDYRQRKRRGKIRRVPMAIGVLQQWPWYERYYSIDREDPLQAATAWMQHLQKQIPKVRRRCKIRHSDTRKLWVAAWVTSIRAPKPGGRCAETPLHYRMLRRWHKQILKDRRRGIQYNDFKNGWTLEEEFYSEEDGC